MASIVEFEGGGGGIFPGKGGGHISRYYSYRIFLLHFLKDLLDFIKDFTKEFSIGFLNAFYRGQTS